MYRANIYVIVFVFIVCWTSGCSKRQIIPGAVAGAGGAMFAASAIYRVALPDEDSKGLFGKQTEQKAAIATLMFTGIALIIAGCSLYFSAI